MPLNSYRLLAIPQLVISFSTTNIKYKIALGIMGLNVLHCPTKKIIQFLQNSISINYSITLTQYLINLELEREKDKHII